MINHHLLKTNIDPASINHQLWKTNIDLPLINLQFLKTNIDQPSINLQKISSVQPLSAMINLRVMMGIGLAMRDLTINIAPIEPDHSVMTNIAVGTNLQKIDIVTNLESQKTNIVRVTTNLSRIDIGPVMTNLWITDIGQRMISLLQKTDIRVIRNGLVPATLPAKDMKRGETQSVILGDILPTLGEGIRGGILMREEGMTIRIGLPLDLLHSHRIRKRIETTIRINILVGERGMGEALPSCR